MADYQVGAQLYTVREFTQTVEGMRDALRKVAEIGYKAVQVSGFGPMDAKEVAAALQEYGLDCVSTHTSWDRFLNDLDAVIEEHKLWGCPHPAIGGLPKEYFSLDGLKRFARELPPIAERLAEEGMTFSYHNHNHELAWYDGKPWLELLYDAIDPRHLKVEIDTYWIQAGGGDPAAWVRRYPGRQPLLHLKDMVVTPEREQRFAKIGEGTSTGPLSWRRKEASVEWYLVEQDQCYGRDPFESLAISYRNLQGMGLR